MKTAHLFVLFCLAPTLPACSGSTPNNLGSLNAGGVSSGVGGHTGAGTGGAQPASTVMTGGSPSSGGTSATTGDATATAGNSPAGGASAMGGAVSSGGASIANTGGVPATGGKANTGGTTPGTGGAIATGGASTASTGGVTATGGAGTGGTLATGGNPNSGGHSATTGGTASAGAPSGGASTIGKPVPDLRCQSDNDCCVVLDSCQVALYLVGASQKAEMEAYLSVTVPRMCTSCMAPNVQVACTNGQCTGTELGTNPNWPPTGLGATHCGKLPVGTGGAPAAPPDPTPASASEPDASTAPTVFGCGV